MNLLHLSDLHFNYEQTEQEIREKWEALYRQVKICLRTMGINAVAVTGDFTSHGHPDEFAMAGEYLQRLAEICKVSERQFWFCAGNHDADTPNAGSSFQHYKDFVREFMPGDFGEGITTLDGTYGFYTMHTCRETSLEDFDHALLQQEDVDRVLKKCGQYFYPIALMHHQPEVLQNPELLETLKPVVNLILSGHLHPSTPLYYQFRGIWQLNGMAVTPHLPQIPSGFQILQMNRGSLQKVIPCFMGDVL